MPYFKHCSTSNNTGSLFGCDVNIDDNMCHNQHHDKIMKKNVFFTLRIYVDRYFDSPFFTPCEGNVTDFESFGMSQNISHIASCKMLI